MKRYLYVMALVSVSLFSCKQRSDHQNQESELASAKGLKLYVDMDGVLTDFIGEYRARAKTEFETDPENWDNINKWGEEYWSEMRPMRDALKLWAEIKKYQPTILTSCGREPSIGCESGKLKWVKKNLGPAVKVIVRYDKEKHANASAVLIDDMLKYLDPWRANQGIGIHHKTADESLKQLNQILSRR